MQFKMLKLLNYLAFIFHKFNIDFNEVKMILEMKMTDHARRETIMLKNSNLSNGKYNKNRFNSALGYYCFLGGIMAMFFFMDASPFAIMSLMTGILLFMLISILIADFSNVLLDLKDRSLLTTFPLKESSITVAKSIYTGIHLFLISIAMSGIWGVIGMFKYGFLFIIPYIISTVLAVFLCVSIAVLLYGILLKHFNGEKIKDIINYFQITFMIFIMVGYNISIRVMEVEMLSKVSGFNIRYLVLPSTWYGAIYELILTPSMEKGLLIIGGLGILIPVALYYYNRKYILPNFEKYLLKMNATPMSTSKKKIRLIHMISGNAIEKASFFLSQKILLKEREFKLKILPSIAFSVFFPFIILSEEFMSAENLSLFISQTRQTNIFLFLYFSLAMICASVYMINCSQHPKLIQQFKALPIDRPSDLMKGAVKAYALMYCFPALSLPILVFLYIYGLQLIPHILLVYSNMCFSLVVLMLIGEKMLPFSRDFQTIKNNSITTTLLSMSVIGVEAFMHNLVIKQTFISEVVLLVFYSVVVLFLAKWLFDKKLSYRWSDL